MLENRDHKKTQYSDIFYAASVMLKVKNPLDQKFLIQEIKIFLKIRKKQEEKEKEKH